MISAICFENVRNFSLKLFIHNVFRLPHFLDKLPVLSVRFEVGVSLLLAHAGADKRGPKAPFPLLENAGIQLAIHRRVPAGAPVGAGSY